MLETIFSIGATTLVSTSLGSAPGYPIMISAIGTSICGSSSLGISIVLYPPINKNAIIKSTVSFDLINAFAILPEKPSFIIILFYLKPKCYVCYIVSREKYIVSREEYKTYFLQFVIRYIILKMYLYYSRLTIHVTHVVFSIFHD